MESNTSSATGYIAERFQHDREFVYAIMADAAGVLFWVAVIAIFVVGFLWLSNFRRFRGATGGHAFEVLWLGESVRFRLHHSRFRCVFLGGGQRYL